MPYFNSLLEYWLLGTIFFYHKDVINIQLVHNLFTHSKTLVRAENELTSQKCNDRIRL